MSERRVAAAMLAALALAACSQPAVEPDHFYRLDAPAPTPFAAPPITGMIAVERPDADSLVGQRAILYSDRAQPLEVMQYSYHYWTQAPPRLLQGLLRDYLASANAAEQVAQTNQRAAGCRLDSTLRRFERVLGAGESTAVIEFDARLVRSGDQATVWQGRYRTTAPVTGTAMTAVVSAFNQAVGTLFDAVATDMAASPIRCPPPPA